MNCRVPITVVNVLRALWVIIVLWYEVGIFFNSVSDCSWPDSGLDLPFHVLLVADPQILDHRSYPERSPLATYFSRLVVDLNLRKNWWSALRKKPDAVVFLGDMMDGGRIDMSNEEYEDYYQRFKSIFQLPLRIPTYFIPGNHDIGLGKSSLFSPQARIRYTSHFGPLNNHISISNHTFVLLDAPTLVEEDNTRVKNQKTAQNWVPYDGGSMEFVHSVANMHVPQPVILFSHIPLARSTFECGPLREKGAIRPGGGLGYQNTLGHEVTSFLLERLRPITIYSGDDHDYCETAHTLVVNGEASRITEISVKSLSMAMGIKRPGFQLLSLSSTKTSDLDAGIRTHADVPCLLPDQISIYLHIYIPLLLISLAILLLSNFLRVHRLRPFDAQRHPSVARSRLIEAWRNDEELYWENYLPPPASAKISKARLGRRCPPSMTVFGRPRFRACPGFLRRSLAKCRSNEGSKQRRHSSLLAGFVNDTRDIAIFPLITFSVICCRVMLR